MAFASLSTTQILCILCALLQLSTHDSIRKQQYEYNSIGEYPSYPQHMQHPFELVHNEATNIPFSSSFFAIHRCQSTVPSLVRLSVHT